MPAGEPRIDDEALAHLERLARLVVPAEEREAVRADLAAVLEFVTQLNELPVESVDLAVSEGGSGRPDVPRPSLDRAAALSVAPETRDGYFEVPRTLDEG
ncbi:MAG TPA: Asp-tRNA(Asn)/Glu-tRNA(Gln) amidotransferase subunit GatC [Trueperaceae bacterium]